MSTPEGKIKDAVKKLLEDKGVLNAAKSVNATPSITGWYYMPVQSGMGVAGIPDFIICFRGRFIAVETKAPGKKPTRFQDHQLNAIGLAGGIAFVVDGEEAVKVLGRLLK